MSRSDDPGQGSANVEPAQSLHGVPGLSVVLAEQKKDRGAPFQRGEWPRPGAKRRRARDYSRVLVHVGGGPEGFGVLPAEHPVTFPATLSGAVSGSQHAAASAVEPHGHARKKSAAPARSLLAAG